ncbi:atp-dependent helicase/deoxyribonuclease subunit b [Anaeramoeba ignava]|uniref:Atp-dependent helicase/deoxyribonuclease subunit b n=1 Tax=Anaeramoeba ignava TaxID=1746090 RepID=A0A9Q0RHP8_ANAIG|nr:atp-dependent helicase/deoxyribonuclease subunit b [Anaeramoeba ignava]
MQKFNQQNNFFIGFSIILFFIIDSQCKPSTEGRIKQMMKRYQINDKRTFWEDVSGRERPRFNQNTQAILATLRNMKKDSLYKISFSFDNRRFETPWFIIYDGQTGKTLTSIEFNFEYEFEEITKITWKEEYTRLNSTLEQPETLLVFYNWIPASQIDFQFGLSFFFIGGFFLVLISILVSIWPFFFKK